MDLVEIARSNFFWKKYKGWVFLKKSALEESLQKLQDIKFYIYDYAKTSLDYRQFSIFKIRLPNREIDLYNYLKCNRKKSAQKIAQQIISDNKL